MWLRRPRRIFSDAGKDAAPTGDEGVASTFLRRGVAATAGQLRNSGLTLDDKAHRLEAVIILHGKQAIGE